MRSDDKLPLPKLRGLTPPWVRLAHRLQNQWRKWFPLSNTPLTLRQVFGLPERRKLTPEEVSELKRQKLQQKEERKRDRDFRREARLFSKKASQTLETPCGIRHVLEKKRGKRIQRVRFMIRGSENQNVIYLKADTMPGHFPHGHSLDELHKPEVIRVVASNLGRITEKWGDPNRPTGGGYRIYRHIGAEGFPVFVDYNDMWGKYQSAAIAKDNWAIPLGLSFNGKAWWLPFPNQGHTLIAGAPGYGKSIRANGMVCALIEHNEPWQVEFIFCDFKGGVEFKFYKGLPHLKRVPRYFIKRKRQKVEDEDDDIPETIEDSYIVKQVKEEIPGLITQPFLMPGLLYWLNLEANHRFELISEAGADCKNISEYNRWAHLHSRAPLPRLVVWIDEWAVIAYNRSIGPVCSDLLTMTANVARAAGIQFVICTQHPNRDVLPGSVIATADTKIVFRIPDQYMSRSLLQTDEAAWISIKGRCIVNSPGIENVPVQVPFISNETIRGIVDDAIKTNGKIGEAKRRGISVSAEEIFAWALQDNGGFLGSREVYEHFRTRGMSQKQARKFVEDFEGDLVTVGEQQYLVAPEVDFPNRSPRRLLARGDITRIASDSKITSDLPLTSTAPIPDEPPMFPGVTCQVSSEAPQGRGIN